MEKEKGLAMGKSFQRLAQLMMISAGFILIGAWTFYNAFQQNPDIHKIFSYIAWFIAGMLFLVLSFVIWVVGHKIIIGKLLKNKEEDESENIKKLFLDMFRGFPNWRYRGMVEKVIVAEKDRELLIKHGYLDKEKIDDNWHYFLGPNALPLISAWKTEQVNEEMRKQNKYLLSLTSLITTLTIVLVMLAIVGPDKLNPVVGTIVIILLIFLGVKIGFWDSIKGRRLIRT